jgi:uncharacterized coiled-coil protein SlyX
LYQQLTEELKRVQQIASVRMDELDNISYVTAQKHNELQLTKEHLQQVTDRLNQCRQQRSKQQAH